MKERPIAGRVAALALGGFVACSSGRAVDEMRGEVRFYPWPHGATLTEDPPRVAEIRSGTVRGLLELEEFSGTLREWERRTGPVDLLRIGDDDFVLDKNIFFYYLASLRRPAVAPRLQIRITRREDDGTETVDLMTSETSRMNRRAQSGGMLYSMSGLAPGRYLLRLEVLDGTELAASGDLRLEYGSRPAP